MESDEVTRHYIIDRPSNSHGLTVRLPVRDTLSRWANPVLIPTLAVSLLTLAFGLNLVSAGEAKTQARSTLRAWDLTLPDKAQSKIEA